MACWGHNIIKNALFLTLIQIVNVKLGWVAFQLLILQTNFNSTSESSRFSLANYQSKQVVAVFKGYGDNMVDFNEEKISLVV